MHSCSVTGEPPIFSWRYLFSKKSLLIPDETLSSASSSTTLTTAAVPPHRLPPIGPPPSSSSTATSYFSDALTPSPQQQQQPLQDNMTIHLPPVSMDTKPIPVSQRSVWAALGEQLDNQHLHIHLYIERGEIEEIFQVMLKQAVSWLLRKDLSVSSEMVNNF